MGLGLVVRGYEVLLATWNGAAYLEQQLDSILRQSQPPVRLLVADDRSSDHTLQLLQAWQERTPFPIHVLPNATERLGSCRTFERLLAASSASYVMPCDQDDIWDVNKAELLLQAMVGLEKHHGIQKPLLVHSDLRLMNAQGEPIASSFVRYQGLDPARDHWLAIALQNVVTGCAALLNRACVLEALRFPPEAVLHDWWLALVAARRGAIAYVPQATVSYRQHGSNLVGASGVREQQRRRLVQLLGPHTAERWIGSGLRQLEACERRFPSADPQQAQALMGLCSPSPWRRLHSALWLRLRKQGWWRSLGFYLALLCWSSRRPQL